MKKFMLFSAVMVIGAGVALAATLSVPFFNDGGANQAFIGVKEATGSDQTVTIVYTALSTGGVPANQTETFFLGANLSWDFRPVASDPTGLEFNASFIPDMTIIGPLGNQKFSGSLQLISATDIVGRYLQISNAGTSATRYGYVLLKN